MCPLINPNRRDGYLDEMGRLRAQEEWYAEGKKREAKEQRRLEKSQPKRICPYCQKAIPRDSSICPYCAKDLRDKTCPYCQRNIPRESNLCPYCAKDVRNVSKPEEKPIEKPIEKIKYCPHCGKPLP